MACSTQSSTDWSPRGLLPRLWRSKPVSEPPPFQCLMAGLPETGKTTLLAALWHVAKSHEVPGSLRLERREGDQEYLNRIANSWSKCAELVRTPGEGEMGVAILLRHPDTNR